MEGGSEGVKKKRQKQDGGIEEREGRRGAQNCTWSLTGSNSSVSSDSSELTVLFNGVRSGGDEPNDPDRRGNEV